MTFESQGGFQKVKLIHPGFSDPLYSEFWLLLLRFPLPKAFAQFFKIPLIMFDGKNRYIQEVFKDAEVGRLREIGFRVH